MMVEYVVVKSYNRHNDRGKREDFLFYTCGRGYFDHVYPTYDEALKALKLYQEDSPYDTFGIFEYVPDNLARSPLYTRKGVKRGTLFGDAVATVRARNQEKENANEDRT